MEVADESGSKGEGAEKDRINRYAGNKLTHGGNVATDALTGRDESTCKSFMQISCIPEAEMR